MPNISDKELRRRSSILDYEVVMLRSIQSLLENGIFSPGIPTLETFTSSPITTIHIPTIPGTKPLFEKDVVITNSIIEAFGIHLRALLDFFYLPHDIRHKEDIRAEDYFTNPDDWRKRRPKINQKQLLSIKNRISKEIAHMTSRRNPMKSRKKWETSKYMRRIDKLVEIFISSCPNSVLSRKCKNDLI
jgi:hypothetical protein